MNKEKPLRIVRCSEEEREDIEPVQLLTEEEKDNLYLRIKINGMPVFTKQMIDLQHRIPPECSDEAICELLACKGLKENEHYYKLYGIDVMFFTSNGVLRIIGYIDKNIVFNIEA